MDVRVERLQEITEEDAIAEGVERMTDERGGWRCYGSCAAHAKGHDRRTSATASYMSLWDSMNKKSGWVWDSNPWVWVVSFEVVKS
jgi:hypothetical protein